MEAGSEGFHSLEEPGVSLSTQPWVRMQGLLEVRTVISPKKPQRGLLSMGTVSDREAGGG